MVRGKASRAHTDTHRRVIGNLYSSILTLTLWTHSEINKTVNTKKIPTTSTCTASSTARWGDDEVSCSNDSARGRTSIYDTRAQRDPTRNAARSRYSREGLCLHLWVPAVVCGVRWCIIDGASLMG